MTKKGCCVVPNCRNGSEKTCGTDVVYQKLPPKEKIRRRWIRAIEGNFDDFVVDTSTSIRVCSDHFETSHIVIGKNGKKSIQLDAVPTIFIKHNVVKKKEKDPDPIIKPRFQSRRAASKEALKQMQILLEDEDDAIEIPDDDYIYKADIKSEPVSAPVVAPTPAPKRKYKLSHRKSSDGNDREVLVLKSIKTPNITNHDVENNLELECWVEELEPCQKERNKKLQDEEKELQEKLEELIKSCKGEVIYKGELTTIIEVSDHVHKTIQAVKASQNAPPPQPIVLNSMVASPQPGYQVLGYQMVTPTSQNKTTKIQVAKNLQAPPSPVTTTSAPTTTPSVSRTSRTMRAKATPTTKSATPVATRSAASSPARSATATPVATRSTAATPGKPNPTRSTGIAPVATRSAAATPVATRSGAATGTKVAAVTPVATRTSGTKRPAATSPPAAVPPATRSRGNTGTSSTPNAKPTESSVEGGLLTGTNLKPKAIVDLTADDGRPLPDSKEVSFNKLQGKTYPSLVVVARPQLRVDNVNSDRAKLDAKVKSVLMCVPAKFTEWLIQQGLVKSEQKCNTHPANQLKLGMYSDVSKFPYSGGYVWISECCPQKFVSVFSGSIFEGSPHPPLVILKLLYHWSCQTNIQNVVQWVKVDNLYIKGMYTWLRCICTLALQNHMRKLGGPNVKVEVGVISLGTTSQDGNSRQVKVEVLGVLESTTQLLRLRAIDPLADGDRNYKKRFAKILEPIGQWVHSGSTIVTDMTVDKATLCQLGFNKVVQYSTPNVDDANSNKTIMEYLRKIVPRMFQNTLSLLSRQIIQQFLDELVWREWFGTTSVQAFDNLVAHIAEQTKLDSGLPSLIVKLSRVSQNPFKQWIGPASTSSTSSCVPPPPIPQAAAKAPEVKKRKRKDTDVPPKATNAVSTEICRPPKSNSPDVPTLMVPLENYYYGTIDNYPPKMNVKLSIKCPVCKEVFTNNIVLMNHLFKHAHAVVKDGQMCRYCLSSVQSESDLENHVATLHPSETKHDNGFICLICETQYMNPFILGKHMSKEHCPAELPYQCGTCGYRCSNHKQAIDHFYKQHNNGPTIQCPFCLKSTTVFSSSRNMTQNMHFFIQHLQKHQKKTYAKRCGKCALWFVQKEVLKEHQLKMHASQRGKTGLVPWTAPRNGVMVPKSKMDKYPSDGDVINFSTLFYNVTKGLKCKECNQLMDTNKHFASYENCQNTNCQYATCCANAMQDHNSKCNAINKGDIPGDKLPCKMFCICGFSSEDGNQMAKHLAICEKKSAYPSLLEAKSASVTHSMLDVLGLVRKPDEADQKPSKTTKRVKKVDEGDSASDSEVKKKRKLVADSKNKEESAVEDDPMPEVNKDKAIGINEDEPMSESDQKEPLEVAAEATEKSEDDAVKTNDEDPVSIQESPEVEDRPTEKDASKISDDLTETNEGSSIKEARKDEVPVETEAEATQDESKKSPEEKTDLEAKEASEHDALQEKSEPEEVANAESLDSISEDNDSEPQSKNSDMPEANLDEETACVKEESAETTETEEKPCSPEALSLDPNQEPEDADKEVEEQKDMLEDAAEVETQEERSPTPDTSSFRGSNLQNAEDVAKENDPQEERVCSLESEENRVEEAEDVDRPAEAEETRIKEPEAIGKCEDRPLSPEVEEKRVGEMEDLGKEEDNPPSPKAEETPIEDVKNEDKPLSPEAERTCIEEPEDSGKEDDKPHSPEAEETLIEDVAKDEDRPLSTEAEEKRIEEAEDDCKDEDRPISPEATEKSIEEVGKDEDRPLSPETEEKRIEEAEDACKDEDKPQSPHADENPIQQPEDVGKIEDIHHSPEAEGQLIEKPEEIGKDEDRPKSSEAISLEENTLQDVKVDEPLEENPFSDVEAAKEEPAGTIEGDRLEFSGETSAIVENAPVNKDSEGSIEENMEKMFEESPETHDVVSEQPECMNHDDVSSGGLEAMDTN